MQTRTRLSRWWWFGMFVLSYLLAVLVTMAVAVHVTAGTRHFSYGLLGFIAIFFPAGLAMAVLGEVEWGIVAAYVVYLLLAIVGTVFRRRWIAYVFAALLIVNIGGCSAAIQDYATNGWGC